MKTLIVRDVHLKIRRAQKIIDAHADCDRRVFLGDIYDDFGDSVEVTREVARWHKEQLADPKNCFLYGNHDISYAFCRNHSLRCSGHTSAKRYAINDIVKKEDWQKTKLYVEIDGWLLSHGGLRDDFADRNLESSARVALSYAATGETEHWMTAPGYARGGDWAKGGLTWLDWDSEFYPIPGRKQIVGHTPGKLPREKDGNWCLDTHLRHAAILEDGKLEVFETDS